MSLPNISKLAGVLISSRESAISDVVEATGVLPDDAKQKLLAVCSKAALLPALLDGHAHMGRVAGAGDMTEWKEKNQSKNGREAFAKTSRLDMAAVAAGTTHDGEISRF